MADCPADHDIRHITLVNGPADLCRHHRQRAAEAGLIRMEPLVATDSGPSVSARINVAVNGERRMRTGS